jgi:TolB protein
MKKLTILLFVLFVTVGCQQQTGSGSIAFSRLTENYWQIWTIRPDGSGSRQLTTSLSDKRYPSWTKDGQKILFCNNNNQAFALELASSEEQHILSHLGMIGSVTESPKAAELLVVRYRTGMKDSSDLWLTSIDGENKRTLTREAGLQYDPTWSPDATEIAYISGQVFKDYELFIMDSDGTNKRRLTNNKALELLPTFSPDGKRIAYVSDITGNYEIWVIDINGRNAKQLTDTVGIDTRPCWSPDGTMILFVSNRSGELQLWIMNDDGSNPKQLTTSAQSIEPTWRTEIH